MREGKRPLEQPFTRALINSLLDYFVNIHGAMVEIIVRDWLEEKEKRLAWKHEDKKDIPC